MEARLLRVGFTSSLIPPERERPHRLARTSEESLMPKQGKKYRAALEKVEPGRKYTLEEGLAKVKEIAFAKFDETVELTMWLGVDPRKADQLVRGTVVLPHGVGKTVRVLVIAQGDQLKEAEEAGADMVGGEEVVNRIK